MGVPEVIRPTVRPTSEKPKRVSGGRRPLLAEPGGILLPVSRGSAGGVGVVPDLRLDPGHDLVSREPVAVFHPLPVYHAAMSHSCHFVPWKPPLHSRGRGRYRDRAYPAAQGSSAGHGLQPKAPTDRKSVV